jgi:hypothetical protein
MKELGFDSKYTPESMRVLGQYCRDWRDQNEEMGKARLDWSVKIYSDDGMGGKLPRGRWSLPAGLIFMPLARPPCVLSIKPHGADGNDWVEKAPLLERWLSAV